MKASLVRGSSIPANHYQCQRCGIIRSRNHSRKPVHCADCRDVLALMARTGMAA